MLIFLLYGLPSPPTPPFIPIYTLQQIHDLIQRRNIPGRDGVVIFRHIEHLDINLNDKKTLVNKLHDAIQPADRTGFTDRISVKLIAQPATPNNEFVL